MTRRTKFISSTDTKLIKNALGVPVVVGTVNFVGGKLPGSAGNITSQAIQPSVPLVGAATTVGLAGVTINQLKRISKIHKTIKRGRR